MPKKREKVTEAFLRLALSPLKVDADDADDAADDADDDDDGRVGIWKAPLPGGTAELKSGRKWQKVGKSSEKWLKVGKSG